MRQKKTHRLLFIFLLAAIGIDGRPNKSPVFPIGGTFGQKAVTLELLHQRSVDVSDDGLIGKLTPTNALDTMSVVENQLEGLCKKTGDILPKLDSCREFYECRQLQNPGSFSISLFSCPLGTLFDMDTLTCVNADSSTPDCTPINYLSVPFGDAEAFETLKRPKREIMTILTGLIAVGSLASAANGIFNTANSGGGDKGMESLRRLEDKLIGMEGNIKGIELSVLESQLESRINSEITKTMLSRGIEENNLNFGITRKLIDQGFLENRMSMAALQGLVAQGNIDNALNFAKVQVSVNQLQQFLKGEMAEAKELLNKGFNSVTEAIDLSRVEPLISELLTLIKSFCERSSHLQSLPEANRRDEIERRSGYLQYLESSTLHAKLRDVIHQNFAKPQHANDITALFMLDLLVHGLQVDAEIKSHIVSANVYLATKALGEMDLESFNTYMMRIQSAIRKIELDVGYGGKPGLLEEVKGVITSVSNLPYAAQMIYFDELRTQKLDDISQLETDIEDLVDKHTEISKPRMINRKPNFSKSTITIPSGPWVAGKKVSYAIQLLSELSLSQVGEWSIPYTISGKAHPEIHIPVSDKGVARLVYRKFNDGTPELVAVLTDNRQLSFRDIGRDLLNAAANPNEDLALSQIQSLINEGADINIFLENEMTALHHAASQGNVKVMEVLLGRGADIQAKAADNKRPLHFAALFGGKEGIEYLVNKNAEKNDQTRQLGLSPLHIAVANSHVEATKVLIDNGAFINIKDNGGLTPLHLSVLGNGDTIDLLLNNVNIDVNAVGENGLTPLHYAARSDRDVYVKKILLHLDTDVNAESDSRMTPLDFAAMGGNMDIITALVEQGGLLTLVDNGGATPLHYAAAYGNQRAIIAIMELEPSLKEVKDTANRTPLDLAVEYDRAESIAVLRANEESLMEIIEAEMEKDLTMAESAEKETKITETCPKDPVNNLTSDTQKMCDNIGHIDSYVNLVMSMLPLQKYYEDHESFSEIFSIYDSDLLQAKDHAKIWRNGESILRGIRRSMKLAKQFEPEFNKKYAINKRLIRSIQATVDQVEIYNKTMEEIKDLKEQIENATLTKEQVKVPAVAAYFDMMIQGYQQQIEEKNQTLHEDITIIKELKELSFFLEFVQRDASKIQEEAQKTRHKIETFRDNLDHDRSAFVRNKRIANDKYEDLQAERIKRNQALEDFKIKITKARADVEKEKQDISNRYARIHDGQKKLQELRDKIMKQMRSNRTWSIIGAIFTPFLIGIPLLIHASNEQKKLVQMEKTAIASNTEAVAALESEIKLKRSEIDRLSDEMEKMSRMSGETKGDLRDFTIIDGDLSDLSSKVDQLLKAIEKAIVGVETIKSVFGTITEKLGSMINTAREAHTEAERLNARYFIYEGLESLQCNWRDAYLNIATVDSCTLSFKVLFES